MSNCYVNYDSTGNDWDIENTRVWDTCNKLEAHSECSQTEDYNSKESCPYWAKTKKEYLENVYN